ncbi:hypothetical protein [Buchananella hordeovulneris]|uniref:hypothetical protein n=1 Tax=Buchananella hordeovulneris TaxID=52770 RepID=UPI000F602D76|nr:hypothetical protein [Buchananella hordeovulneris]MDO5080083.1 hypothetical protein [Buchananella hordeovulneris]RRD44167.1 hypothetical protein EII13_05535 [Buchananella hordeovulneris]RRD51623.1 hypothetical protein EII12_08145 [Buchananella hordeovulneris]
MQIRLHACAAEAQAATRLARAVQAGWDSVAPATWEISSSVVAAQVRDKQFTGITLQAPPLPAELATTTDLVLVVVANLDHRAGGAADPTPVTQFAAAAAELAVPCLVLAGRSEVVRREYADIPLTHVVALASDAETGNNGVVPDVEPAQAHRAAARLARTWAT